MYLKRSEMIQKLGFFLTLIFGKTCSSSGEIPNTKESYYVLDLL